MNQARILLRLQDFNAGYDHKVIVKAASLEVPSGSVVALLGANGAGKTTLLKTAIGLLPRLGGSCWFGSDELNQLSNHERARRVSWVPQAAESVWRYTVREVITQARYAHRGPFASLSGEDELAVQQAMATMDVEQFSWRSLQELSGGEARRVLIARALAQDTPLLALDEPAAHLDPGRQIELMQILRRIADSGKGVLVSVHDVNAARRYADHIVLIYPDGSVAFGDTESTLTVDKLDEAMDTRFIEGYDQHYGKFLLPMERLHKQPAPGNENVT